MPRASTSSVLIYSRSYLSIFLLWASKVPSVMIWCCYHIGHSDSPLCLKASGQRSCGVQTASLFSWSDSSRMRLVTDKYCGVYLSWSCGGGLQCSRVRDWLVSNAGQNTQPLWSVLCTEHCGFPRQVYLISTLLSLEPCVYLECDVHDWLWGAIVYDWELWSRSHSCRRPPQLPDDSHLLSPCTLCPPTSLSTPRNWDRVVNQISTKNTHC